MIKVLCQKSKEIFYSRWFPLYLLLLVPIVHSIVGYIFGKDLIMNDGQIKEQGWFFVANAFEYLGVNIAIVYLFTYKHTRAKMLYIMLASFIMYVLEIFDVFGEWLFNNSPIAHNILANFQPRDGDAIFMMVYLILFVLHLIRLLVGFMKNHVHVNSILITMNLFAIIGLTTLFHLYSVQYNYNNVRKEIWEEMENALFLNKEDFKIVCEFKKWECAYNDEDPRNTILPKLPPIFKEIYSEMFEAGQNQAIVKTSRTIHDPVIDTRHRFINYKKNNIWIVDTTQAFIAFDRAEAIFLSLCAIGHFFWMYLTLMLIIIHKDKYLIINEKNNKWVMKSKSNNVS